MPAPERPKPTQSFTTSVAVPKGIVGVYTDLEVDALLSEIQVGGGGGTVDLSDYYTKAEVDAALANVATGGTIDLDGYATVAALDAVRTEIVTNAGAAFMERYTKQEVDGLFVKQADMVAPPSLDGYATEQYVDDTIARIPAADLSAYAKLQDADQAITAKSLTLDTNSLIVDSSGGQKRLCVKVGTKTFPLAYTNELIDYAYANNDQQIINADRMNVQTLSFGPFADTKAALGFGDTNEGYGERLILSTNSGAEYLVYKSDLEGQVADKTPWQRLALEAGWRNGPGAYPAAEVRWNGDNLEFRGVAETIAAPAVDSATVFARLPADCVPATIRNVTVSTMQGTAGGLASLQIRPDGTMKVSFRLITATQVSLDFTLPGAK